MPNHVHDTYESVSIVLKHALQRKSKDCPKYNLTFSKSIKLLCKKFDFLKVIQLKTASYISWSWEFWLGVDHLFESILCNKPFSNYRLSIILARGTMQRPSLLQRVQVPALGWVEPRWSTSNSTLPSGSTHLRTSQTASRARRKEWLLDVLEGEYGVSTFQPFHQVTSPNPLFQFPPQFPSP